MNITGNGLKEVECLPVAEVAGAENMLDLAWDL